MHDVNIIIVYQYNFGSFFVSSPNSYHCIHLGDKLAITIILIHDNNYTSACMH